MPRSVLLLSVPLSLSLLLRGAAGAEPAAGECGVVPVEKCCEEVWSNRCPQPHCYKPIVANCPERKSLVFSRQAGPTSARDLRRAPPKTEEVKCGTAETNYQPCTSKAVANKLFSSCCELYAPPECQFMCKYETDQQRGKELLQQMTNSTCSFKHLSSILYCASQNRDNRQCCQDLELNAPELMVGSRCLRMCDPSGSTLGKVTKEDVTCLFNWNVLMYCHHSGIREM